MTAKPTIIHIQPFNSKDLAARSLSDRLSDLDDLTTLYPNIDKKAAFDKFKIFEGNLNKVHHGGERRAPYVQAMMRLVVLQTEASSSK